MFKTSIFAAALFSLSLLSGTAATAEAGGFEVRESDGHLWIFRAGTPEAEAARAGELPEKHVTSLVSGPGGVAIYKAPDASTLAEWKHRKPGFTVRVADGRTWVFLEGSEAARAARAGELPEKHVTRIRSDGGSVTVYKAPDAETLEAYGLARPGFAVRLVDGKAWVLPAGSEALEAADRGELPEKHVTRIVAHDGEVQTFKAVDSLVLRVFLDPHPGYQARIVGDRAWLFREGTAALAHADDGELPEKHVTRVVPENGDVTVYKAPDMDVLRGYFAARPGWAVRPRDAQVWVFQPGSAELADFDSGHVPEKHATRVVNVGGSVRVLKSPHSEVLRGYLATRSGYVGRVRDGYLWVFRNGSDELATFDSGGELAKHVTRVTTGPTGRVVTVKAPDSATLGAWMSRTAAGAMM